MAAINAPELDTPEKAEAAFYSAFEICDLEAMMAVWCDDKEAVCIHPHGPRLTGSREIRDGWRQIMAHSPRIRFKVDDLHTIQNADLAIHLVNEDIHVGDTEEPDFTILATNVYRRTADGWRIVLHHASPTPEALQNIAGNEAMAENEENENVTIH